MFAYGSNLDSVRMKDRVSSARLVGRSLLNGHELRFHKRGSRDGTGKANAFATGRPADEVWGVIWEIDAGHLSALDEHEGRGLGYERELHLFLTSIDDESVKVEAWVYVAQPDAIDDRLLPMRWYLDHVVRGAREHALPALVVERMRQQPTED